MHQGSFHRLFLQIGAIKIEQAICLKNKKTGNKDRERKILATEFCSAARIKWW